MDMGELRRTTPISTSFGYDRGNPLDRRYIEDFLRKHSSDIQGRVLEIGDNSYTVQFGGAAVTQSEVFNRHPGDPQTTFTGDLSQPDALPTGVFDCIVFTQTLHLIYDMRAAVAMLHEALRPGGVLLATVPYVCPIDRGEWRETWYWSITPLALERLLTERFGGDHVSIQGYGNTLSATAFLYGLAEHELTEDELDTYDPCCPVTVMGRAIRAKS